MARGGVIRLSTLKELAIWLPLFIPIVLYFFWKDALPKSIPSHYALDGTPDAVMPPINLILFLMAAGFFVNILLMLIPFADPKKADYVYRSSLYFFVRFFLTVILSGIAIMSMLQGMGYVFPITRIIMAAIFLLFAGIGWMMRTVETNYFVGIRLPWTLKNKALWERTHRLSGGLLFACSILSLVLTFVLPDVWDAVLLFGTIGVGLIYPAVQSYFWK